MLSTPIARLRLIGLIEGVSYLVLLFVGVPLKRILGHPEMVEIVGPIHGGLFLLYVLAAALAARWPGLPPKLFLLTLVASILPFGPFFIDPRLKQQERPQSA